MFAQASTLSSLPTMVMSTIIALLFFTLTTVPVAQVWARFACERDDQGTCNYDPIIILLGTAVAAFAHAIAVALFAWTPLSSPLRNKHQRNMFNAFLYASFFFDIIPYAYALTLIRGFVPFLQALTITFNVPFLLIVPYLTAAYRDPTSDLGALLHHIRSRLSKDTGNNGPCHCGEDACLHGALERAFLIAPSGAYAECEFDENEDSSPATPPFTFFVTAPPEDKEYVLLPVTHQV
ncbi:hypothetical protein DL93DRAFT_2224044 [Clavulina sp. PMI_390]|nr:hypothetical protein DL93DRAFT_2224044 [Clavulina sp. PMI_390]